MSGFRPTGGWRGRRKCSVTGKHHYWRFAYTGKACQISECQNCGEIKWKGHKAILDDYDYKLVGQDLRDFQLTKAIWESCHHGAQIAVYRLANLYYLEAYSMLDQSSEVLFVESEFSDILWIYINFSMDLDDIDNLHGRWRVEPEADLTEEERDEEFLTYLGAFVKPADFPLMEPVCKDCVCSWCRLQYKCPVQTDRCAREGKNDCEHKLSVDEFNCDSFDPK